jgi:sialic acid synthase SpsE
MVLMVPQYKTFIIANVGASYGGDLSRAKESVTAAKKAGCDAVEFDMSKLSYQQQEELIGYCRDTQIEFIPMPMSTDDLNFVMGAGVRRVRVSSDNMFNLKFLKDLANWCLNEPRLNVILPTFGIDRQEINDAVRDISATSFTLLHSRGFGGFNLLKIKELGLYGSTRVTRIGFSDPAVDYYQTALSVLAGATVIEKAFMPSWIGQMTEMVKTIRSYEELLGNVE